MKIVTWNCNGALRKKFEHLLEFDADIYVIQECENPKETENIAYQKWANNYLWIGDTKNKGVGVFASNNIELKKLEWGEKYRGHNVKYFLPCLINQDFNLLAVWTHRNNSPNFGYIGQLWKYIQVNKNKFNKIIIAGDFNSNTIWDEWDRWWNHSDVVNELKEMHIQSLYHQFTGQKQGEELTPTLYFQKKMEKPFHIDYIFASQELSKKIKYLKIGTPHKWLHLSDHMPIICFFE